MSFDIFKYPLRFYKRTYPLMDENVMVIVKGVTEMGVYVHLLEYQNNGLVLISELSRRRIRSVNKIVKVGKREIVVVIRVDETKDYIDLSKRRVVREDIKKCEEKYIRGKSVVSVVKNAAETLKIDCAEKLEDFMARTAWVFDEKYKSLGGAYYAFKKALVEHEILKELNLVENEYEALLNTILVRMEPKRLKMRAEIELSCYLFEGVEAIKKALNAGLEFNKEAIDDIHFLEITLISAPIFSINSICIDIEEGLFFLSKVVDKIQDVISEFGGECNTKIAPEITTPIEDDLELTPPVSDEEGGDEEEEYEETSEEYDEEYSGKSVTYSSEDHVDNF